MSQASRYCDGPSGNARLRVYTAVREPCRVIQCCSEAGWVRAGQPPENHGIPSKLRTELQSGQ